MDEKSTKKGWRETKNLFYVILIVILVILLSGLIVVLKLKKIYGENVCVSADCVDSSEYFLDIINNSVNPCDNFYEFACGGYKGSVSTLEYSQKRVLEEYKLLTTDRIKDDDCEAVKKQKVYYRTCMNTSAIERDDNESFKKLLEQLGGWPLMSIEWITTYNLEKLTQQCVDMGLYYDWFVDIDTSVLSYKDPKQLLQIAAPKNTYLVEEKYNENYQLLIENIVKRLGSKKTLDNIAKSAKSIVDFEVTLSKIISESGYSFANVTILDLKELFASLPWSALLSNVVIEENTEVQANILYFQKLVRLLEQTGISVKTNYIFWKITQSLYPFLSRDIRREFETYNMVVSNNEPAKREDYCYGITQTVFEYISEGAYARKYSLERESIKKIIDNIKFVLQDHINVSKWMNDTHKTYALDKLNNIKVFIGAPDEVFDENIYDHILGVDEIDILHLNNTLDIIRAVDLSRDKYNLNLQRKKISLYQAEFYRTIVSIEAKYMPNENLVYIPAAIIGGVFDTHKGLNFRNYSVLGTIIAHEFSHAFGILDHFGQINESTRWSNESFFTFLQETRCLLTQCSEFDITGKLNKSCNAMFDENFADYSSIDISYEAFQKVKAEEINQLPGLKYTLNQLFWIGYAGTMCDDNIVHKDTYQTHLDPVQRILGSYRNSQHFAKDFNCTIGSYMNPPEKCTVF